MAIVKGNSFPLNINDVLKCAVKVHLMTYRHFMKLHGLSLEETIELLGSEDGALWYHEETDTYVLLFNDQVENKSRIRWTIAHELGHYTLNHHAYLGADIISRNKVEQGQYKILEQEADYFAKRFLAPYSVVVKIANLWHRISRKDLMWLFGLGFESAGYYISELNKRNDSRWGIVSDGNLVDQYRNYFETLNHLGFCTGCEVPMNYELHDTCPICGDRIIHLTEETLDPTFDLLCSDDNPMTRLIIN
ncbi:ImmA/IrrE family metallo-endopeptidase [Lacticaseibacillus rhamnosus]